MYPHEISPLNYWYCQVAALFGTVALAWYLCERDGRTEYERDPFRGGFKEPPFINRLIGRSILLTLISAPLFYLPCLFLAAYYQTKRASSSLDQPSLLWIPVFYVTYGFVCLLLAGVFWQCLVYCRRVLGEWIHSAYESVTDCFLLSRVHKIKRALSDEVSSEAFSRLCKLDKDYRCFAKSGPSLLHPWCSMKRLGHSRLFGLLLTLLREHHPHYYGVTARILAQVKDPRATPLLVTSLLKGNSDAASALRAIGDEKCVPDLLAGVMSVHEGTAHYNPQTVPLAARLIIDVGYASLSQRQRLAVAIQGSRFDLAGLEGDAAVDPLAAVLARHHQEEAVVRALADTGSPLAVRPLIEYIKTPREFALAAVDALESFLANIADRIPTVDLNSLANLPGVTRVVNSFVWDSNNEYQSRPVIDTELIDVDVGHLRRLAREQLSKRADLMV